MAAVLVIVAVLVAAFALGSKKTQPASQAGGTASSSSAVAMRPLPNGIPTTAHSEVEGDDKAAATAGSVSGGSGGSSSQAVDAVASTRGLGATRVVKTGSLSLTVAKGRVAATIASLTKTTADLGGYVSQSRTEDVNGTPTGSLTLRIPVDRFEAAISAAARLGHETSLRTDAHDVTGEFVDTKARLSALQRTRSTYLTILSRARTIGQTLSVQQRVNDIQQQIESLQGRLKVLRNQSADGTLTVQVTTAGAVATVVSHHPRSGWSKAWHTSTGRFNRGMQAIIGGLGPLLLALLILGSVFLIARIATRRQRRRPGETSPVVST